MALYGEKYHIHFVDSLNNNYIARIYERDRSIGTSTELIGTVTPSTLNIGGNEDELIPQMLTKSWDIQIIDSSYGTYDEFFTYDDLKYKLIITKGNEWIYVGYLNSNDFKRALWSIGNNIVTITFTDRLSTLKDIDFLDNDGTLFTGKMTLMNIIFRCLKKTGLELRIYEGCYIYERFINQGHNSMLTEIYLDAEVFTKDNKPSSCYDVINEILRRFHLILMQDHIHDQTTLNGICWKITSINAFRQPSIIYQIFHNVTNSYQGEASISPQVAVDGTINWFWDEPQLEFQPSWKNFTLKQDYGLDNNLFQKFGYESTQITYWDGRLEQFIDIDGFCYIKSGSTNYIKQNNILVSINSSTTPTEYVSEVSRDVVYGDNVALKINIDVKGWHHIKILYIVGNIPYYLDTNNEWTTQSVWYHEGFEDYSVNFVTDILPGDGRLIMRFYFHVYNVAPRPSTDKYSYINIDNTNASIIYITDAIHKTDVDLILSDIDYITTINNLYTYKPEDYYVKIGDLPNILNAPIMYKGGLYRYSGGNYIPTTEWNIYGSGQHKSLNSLISDEICSNHLYPTYKINGEINAEFDNYVVFTLENRVFLVLRGNYDNYSNNLSCDLVEIFKTEQGFLKLKGGGYIRLKSGGKIKIH